MHSFVLIVHVGLLGLLWFWEVPVHILYGDQWPGGLVTVVDALEPRCFAWENRGCMEVLDRALQAWELVKIVDSIPCCMVGIEELNVIKD